MTIYDWLTISLICVAGATTPGPSLLVIVYINNREGMISGIIASIAHGIGIFIYALISIYAISFINKNLPTITPILQLIGALFLIFISYKMIFFKSSKNIFQNNLQLSKKYSGSFLLGLTTSIINPKILIFLTSVFSQFINDEFSNYTKIGIGLLAGIIDAVWYILVSYSVNLKKLRDYIILKQKLVFFIFGIILITISIYLVHVSIRYFI
jgi:threonine/homoserine/homoserine lactone efflux protein